MELESSLIDSPELDPSTGSSTKRPLALPDVNRETKRLCTEFDQWPYGNGGVELNNGLGSWADDNALSNPEFGGFALQHGSVFGTHWSNAILQGNFGQEDLIFDPQSANSGSILLDPIHSQQVETDMQTNWPEEVFYPQSATPLTTDVFDLNSSFQANQNITPSFEISQDPNGGYGGNLLQSWILPEPSYMPFHGPSIDAASTSIDVTAETDYANIYCPPESVVQPESENEEIEVKSEGLLVPDLEKVELVGGEDTSSHVMYQDGDISPVQIDICFGVIIANVTSSWTGGQGMMETPVTVTPMADIMKLSFQDSKKYAGILNLPVMCKLQEEFTIEYNAKMIASKSQKSQRASKGKLIKPNTTNDCSVRIVVYGLKLEGYAVGNLLSEAGLYFQHPSVTELCRHVDYWNPHYLLRPGSQFPKLEALSLSTDRSSVVSTEPLDEAHKSRFMRIFNSANGPISHFHVTASPRLKMILKDHQITALAMMMEKECGIVENAKFPTLWWKCQSSPTPVYGGILADEMGLGKTLSLLSLVCSSLDSLPNQKISPEDRMSRATLVVTPKSTIPGWQQQVKKHIHAGQLRLVVYHGSNRQRLSSQFWDTNIVLTTYETLRSECAATGPLYSGTWRRVVLDEAHHIRNRSSQSFKAACAVTARSRWCLTGTPIHNSIDDYGALLSFLGVPLLMEKSQFDFWITSLVKRKKPNSLSTLGHLVRATCLRRTKDITQNSLQLPQRIERIEEIKLHQADQELYDFFRDKTAKIAAGLAGVDEGASKIGKRKDANVLTLINFLRRICNHGEDLLPQSALEVWKSNSTSRDWQMMRMCNKICDFCRSPIEGDGDCPDFGCRHSICTSCYLQSENPDTEEAQKCPKCEAMQDTFGNSSISPKSPHHHSAKVEALIRNLHTEQAQEHCEDETLPMKSVVFSHWTKMLDLIASALTQHGFQFQRIDGQSSLWRRSAAMEQFRDDPTYTVMIASIGSAGEGVDLMVANHVHLLEPHWNSMAEAQAVDRVHRIGQTREVTVTRYIVSGTIGTYIQWVQQDKLRLVSRSLGSAEIEQGDIDDTRWKTLQIALGVSNQRDCIECNSDVSVPVDI